MKRVNKNIIISIILFILAIVFTVMVKLIDVNSAGLTNTSVGFSHLNQFIFDTFGVNMFWYDLTEIMGLIAIVLAASYALIGLIQLIKRKSLLKVDKEIIILGIFYVIVILLYILFEKFIVNYRPILIDGVLEASYPSSHTLMIICLCGSAIIINRCLFNNKFTKIINILLVMVILMTVVGRLVSGVHWFTDIIGGIIIASALLMAFYSVISMLKKN